MRELIKTCLLTMLLCAAASAQVSLEEIRRNPRHIDQAGVVEDQVVDISPPPGAVGKVRKAVPNQPGATNLRLHLTFEAPPELAWSLRALDSNGNVAWTFEPGAQPLKGSSWSDEIRGSRATIEINLSTKNDPAKPLILKIVQIAKGTTPTQDESITPPNNLIPVASELKAMGRPVGRLRFIGDNKKRYFCTAFLVSRDLMLTNHHCISTETERESARVDFDFDADSPEPTGGASFSKLEITNFALDFSVLRLKEPVPASRGCLILDGTPPTVGSRLIIIQHPNGGAKRMSRLGCQVKQTSVAGLTPEANDFSHLCDTDGGSSGSAIIDRTLNKVVGLHHLGFDPPDSVSEFKSVNRAVQIGLILKTIEVEKNAVLQEILSPCN